MNRSVFSPSDDTGKQVVQTLGPGKLDSSGPDITQRPWDPISSSVPWTYKGAPLSRSSGPLPLCPAAPPL